MNSQFNDALAQQKAAECRAYEIAMQQKVAQEFQMAQKASSEYGSNCVATEQSPIHAGLSSLETVVLGASHLLSVLESRMDPVMRPVNIGKAMQGESVPTPRPYRIVDQLRDSEQGVIQICQRLEEILSRLEL